MLFQQAALSGRVPEDSILVTVHEVDLLPDKMQDKAPSAFHVWLVEGNEWNSIHLNTHLLAPEQVREEFINLISRLKYAAIVSYLAECLLILCYFLIVIFCNTQLCKEYSTIQQKILYP